MKNTNIETEIQPVNSKNQSRFSLGGILADVLALATIIGVGWFLIGYYTEYEFLATGYQDWIYHAFRIRDIADFGIASWDHIWGNGLNHWRAFQYIEHVFTYEVTRLTGWSITHAMIWITVMVFIFIRVLIYGALRYLGIGPLLSLFSVIVSYSFSQQWIAIKDYSIFIGFIILPIYVLLWIATLNNKRYLYILAAVTGALWSVHPVVGYSASGMFFLLLVNDIKNDFWKMFRTIIIFLVSSLPFTVPYFFSGYSLSNPIFATRQFILDTILPDYFGLSLGYFILLGLSWLIMLWRSNESPRWAKVLLFYCSAYLVFIYFGQLGYYPTAINKFQFSRAIPFIALVLSFCFAAFLHVVLGGNRSRMIKGLLVLVSVFSVSQAISVASQYTAEPVHSIEDPVAIYFSDKETPSGSVYFKNGVESSYLGERGLRFITSYNQHLLPNPYPIRFDSLMKTDISYTGVTEHQIELINDYATALGIEYLFIPRLSPLVNALTNGQGNVQAVFEKKDEITTKDDAYVVLHNTEPIVYAYAFEHDDINSLINFDELPKPTLRALSYSPWDEEITRMTSLIREGKFTPLPLSFEWPNQLRIDTSRLTTFRQPEIVLAQSYDRAWQADVSGVAIEPTSLRFMHLTLSEGAVSNEIHLENHWPWWHWPIQSAGISMVVLTSLMAFISARRSKGNQISVS